MEVNVPFLLCVSLYLRAIFQVQAPGGLVFGGGGDLTEGFLRYRIGGLIFGGAYTWRGFFSEFYGMCTAVSRCEQKLRLPKSIANSRPRPYSIKNGPGIRTFIKNSPQSGNNILKTIFPPLLWTDRNREKVLKKDHVTDPFPASDNSFTAIWPYF